MAKSLKCPMSTIAKFSNFQDCITSQCACGLITRKNNAE